MIAGSVEWMALGDHFPDRKLDSEQHCSYQ
jgi:hypothetical protein